MESITTLFENEQEISLNLKHSFTEFKCHDKMTYNSTFFWWYGGSHREKVKFSMICVRINVSGVTLLM